MAANTDFKIIDRQRLEEIEQQTLAPYAATSSGAHQSRLHPEPEHRYRTAFQRDRDRIIHSRAFRRLKHKRQVFLTSESDHYRTRITHTLEVSQISRTMARALGLNEDLTEAIALGHDIGHTPFGHLGEVILHEIMSGDKKIASAEFGHNFGGFKHNYQSVRVVDFIERKYHFRGLNLTAPVREGILKHTRLLRGRFNYPDFHYQGLNFDQDMASNLEGQVVAICDEIAQRTHDLEDGMRAKLVETSRVRQLRIVQMIEEKLKIPDSTENDRMLYPGLLIRGLINLLVDDVIQNSLNRVKEFVARENR
ncbi:MAG TPA: dNTP triphosphohydrolase, partial [bacterium]